MSACGAANQHGLSHGWPLRGDDQTVFAAELEAAHTMLAAIASVVCADAPLAGEEVAGPGVRTDPATAPAGRPRPLGSAGRRPAHGLVPPPPAKIGPQQPGNVGPPQTAASQQTDESPEDDRDAFAGVDAANEPRTTRPDIRCPYGPDTEASRSRTLRTLALSTWVPRRERPPDPAIVRDTAMEEASAFWRPPRDDRTAVRGLAAHAAGRRQDPRPATSGGPERQGHDTGGSDTDDLDRQRWRRIHSLLLPTPMITNMDRHTPGRDDGRAFSFHSPTSYPQPSPWSLNVQPHTNQTVPPSLARTVADRWPYGPVMPPGVPTMAGSQHTAGFAPVERLMPPGLHGDEAGTQHAHTPISSTSHRTQGFDMQTSEDLDQERRPDLRHSHTSFSAPTADQLGRELGTRRAQLPGDSREVYGRHSTEAPNSANVQPEHTQRAWPPRHFVVFIDNRALILWFHNDTPDYRFSTYEEITTLVQWIKHAGHPVSFEWVPAHGAHAGRWTPVSAVEESRARRANDYADHAATRGIHIQHDRRHTLQTRLEHIEARARWSAHALRHASRVHKLFSEWALQLVSRASAISLP